MKGVRLRVIGTALFIWFAENEHAIDIVNDDELQPCRLGAGTRITELIRDTVRRETRRYAHTGVIGACAHIHATVSSKDLAIIVSGRAHGTHSLPESICIEPDPATRARSMTSNFCSALTGRNTRSLWSRSSQLKTQVRLGIACITRAIWHPRIIASAGDCRRPGRQ